MSNQLWVEFSKLKTSMIYWGMVLFFIGFGMSYAFAACIPLGFSGSEVFLATIGDTSIIFMQTMFISYFAGMDFQHRTIHNEIRVGCSRRSVLQTRFLLLLPAAAILHFIYAFLTAGIVSAVNGFGTEAGVVEIVVKSLLAFLQIAAIQSFTLLFVYTTKKNASGMLLSIGFTVITCNILRNFFDGEDIWFKYSSFYRIMMNGGPLSARDAVVSVVSAILTIAVVFLITYTGFRKAELK